jgi:hypothetical protein
MSKRILEILQQIKQDCETYTADDFPVYQLEELVDEAIREYWESAA